MQITFADARAMRVYQSMAEGMSEVQLDDCNPHYAAALQDLAYHSTEWTFPLTLTLAARLEAAAETCLENCLDNASGRSRADADAADYLFQGDVVILPDAPAYLSHFWTLAINDGGHALHWRDDRVSFVVSVHDEDRARFAEILADTVAMHVSATTDGTVTCWPLNDGELAEVYQTNRAVWQIPDPRPVITDEFISDHADYTSAMPTRAALIASIAALQGAVLTRDERARVIATLCCVLVQQLSEPHEGRDLATFCDLAMFG
jgi:hypothetical protein